MILGYSQNHLAVAGGYAVGSNPETLRGTTRYHEVVLTCAQVSFFWLNPYFPVQ